MNKLRSVLAAATVLVMGLAACGGQDEGGTAQQDDGPPRTKPGYVTTLSKPVEVQRKKAPPNGAIYAPFVHFSVEAFGTVDTIRKDGTNVRPAKGEKFYAVRLAIEPQMSDVRMAHRLDSDTRLELFPRAAGVDTSRSSVDLNLDKMYAALSGNESHTEKHTIIASGNPQNPPVLQVFEEGAAADNPIELNLVNGKVSGPSPMIKPASLGLSDSYSDTTTTDRPTEDNIRVSHSVEFRSAELASFAPGAYLANDENVVTVRAEWKYEQQGTDSPGPVYDPARTAQLVDADGNVYKANHLSRAGKEAVDNGEPVDGVHVLNPGETEQVRFSFAVPRGVTEFTFVYQPLIGYSEANIRLQESEIPLDFSSKVAGS